MECFGHFDVFWSISTKSGIFDYFCYISTFLIFFGQIDYLWSFSTLFVIYGHFWSISIFLANFGQSCRFRPFLIIFNHFDQVRSFWHFNDFGPFKGIFDQNLVVRYQVIFILGLLWSNFAGFKWAFILRFLPFRLS